MDAKFTYRLTESVTASIQLADPGQGYAWACRLRVMPRNIFSGRVGSAKGGADLRSLSRR